MTAHEPPKPDAGCRDGERAGRGRFRDPLTGVDGRPSVAAWFRARRFAKVLDVFPELADLSVVDLGGRPSSWRDAPVRPRSVLCVNLEEPSWTGAGISCVVGDVCDADFVGSLGSFDLAFSNSTIEHVGGHFRRVQFAAIVSGVAPRYWVQTPYRYAPLEPHAVFPGFQFLPVSTRRAIARRWPLSPLGTGGDLLEEILNIDLLSATEMRFYFPDGRLWRERVAGLTKSVVAYRSHRPGP